MLLPGALTEKCIRGILSGPLTRNFGKSLGTLTGKDVFRISLVTIARGGGGGKCLE